MILCEIGMNDVARTGLPPQLPERPYGETVRDRGLSGWAIQRQVEAAGRVGSAGGIATGCVATEAG